MQPHELPEHLAQLRPHLERFIAIAAHHNLTQTEAAMRFALGGCRAENIVFGVDTTAQLTEDVAIETTSADNSLVAEMREAFRDLNRGAINPSLWGKIKNQATPLDDVKG